jgi:hypothetical protein
MIENWLGLFIGAQQGLYFGAKIGVSAALAVQ